MIYFASYEEADALRTECVICGKHKLSVIGHFLSGVTFYTLERCYVEGCELHCFGHEIELDTGSENYVVDRSF